MIKLILIAFLSLALSGPVSAGLREDELEEFNKDCQIAGSVKVKLSINVPPGGCGCDSDEEEEEDLCLGLENSKKISDAVLNVLSKNGNSYDVINALLVQRFISGMEYNDFADNIKNNDFDFEGYSDLKELVEKYRVCKKECAVFFTLRKALRENSADATFEVYHNDDGTSTLVVRGDLIILSDAVHEVQEQLNKDSSINLIFFRATTFIADASLPSRIWERKNLGIEATNFLVGLRVVAWDVTYSSDASQDGSIVINGVQNWDLGADGGNILETYPAYIEE